MKSSIPAPTAKHTAPSLARKDPSSEPCARAAAVEKPRIGRCHRAAAPDTSTGCVECAPAVAAHHKQRQRPPCGTQRGATPARRGQRCAGEEVRQSRGSLPRSGRRARRAAARRTPLSPPQTLMPQTRRAPHFRRGARLQRPPAPASAAARARPPAQRSPSLSRAPHLRHAPAGAVSRDTSVWYGAHSPLRQRCGPTGGGRVARRRAAGSE